MPLPLQTALHTGRSIGTDADLAQARQERQEAGQDGEPGPEVEVAEGEGCKWRVIIDFPAYSDTFFGPTERELTQLIQHLVSDQLPGIEGNCSW